jgi:predicted anti-sigma-YlaC factor YlaD
MDCSDARTLYSASLDGEATAGEELRWQRHVASCTACRAFAADAAAAHRFLRIAPAEPVPDLTASILRATAEPVAPASPWGLRLRLALVAVAVVQILIAIPTLLGGEEHTQHLSAFDLALAIGFLWVAARPARALSGFLPIGTALVLLCLGLAFADAARGDGETMRAVTHSLAVLGMIGAWLLEAQVHHRAAPAPPLAA